MSSVHFQSEKVEWQIEMKSNLPREVETICYNLNALLDALPTLQSSLAIRKAARERLNDDVLGCLYTSMYKVGIAAGRHFDTVEDPNYGEHAFENLAVEPLYKQVAIFQCVYELGWAVRSFPEFNEKFIKGQVEVDKKRVTILARKNPDEAPTPFPAMKEGLGDPELSLYFHLQSFYSAILAQTTTYALRELLDRRFQDPLLTEFTVVMKKVCVIEGRYWDFLQDPEFGRHAFENLAVRPFIKQKAVIQFAFENGVIDEGIEDFNSRFNEALLDMHERMSTWEPPSKPFSLKSMFRRNPK
jgi:hypothetical protein